jgi:hypothetical protein
VPRIAYMSIETPPESNEAKRHRERRTEHKEYSSGGYDWGLIGLALYSRIEEPVDRELENRSVFDHFLIFTPF